MVSGCPSGRRGASKEYIVEVGLGECRRCDKNIEGPVYTHKGCMNVVGALIFSVVEVCYVGVYEFRLP